ncbi:hypothetical protein P4V86_01380 [Brevibacillus laterosporus]|uniref:hypothetical protein n=1 Tax=Brevibacillus laterosporus TaxID=1465 RepID=UPI0003790D0B|nr:hypothetical protein [Brevibacillus laterosporus]ATO49511.1 hypothetical protein BrL25_10510 [Brevibacillus laterosporus DSM 25]MBG9802042.1 hypothetical protein [Brevibacillus laterosporus]MED2002011.1 hypothetical protein [Brevibacillus laterosporus]MED4764818.1 hypothetical protein [Brevibacillus laterosporus]TPH22118.1 hypothetical protein EGH09_02275 [Brevibacillus laterosporus]
MNKFIKICLLLTLMLVSACSEPSINTKDTILQKQSPVSSPENKFELMQKSDVMFSDDKATLSSRENDKLNVPFKIRTYDLRRDTVEGVSVAPEYVNEEIIAFDTLDAKEEYSFVGTYNKKSKAYKKIYVAPKGRITNSLTGINKSLYWVEYDSDLNNELHWSIIAYNLSNATKKTIKSGVTKNEIDPPILGISNGNITWIEYDFPNKKVISKVVSYSPTTGNEKVIATVELDESNGRNGVFFSSMNAVDEGFIVHQSIFDKNNSTKKYRISFYPNQNNTHPLHLLEKNRVIDYTVGGNWFVWTEEGAVFIASLKDGKVKYRFDGYSKKLTNDTPIIKENFLFYRYAINQIFVVDLNTGQRMPISANQTLTSKLYKSGRFISFALDDDEKNKDVIKMYVLE